MSQGADPDLLLPDPEPEEPEADAIINGGDYGMDVDAQGVGARQVPTGVGFSHRHRAGLSSGPSVDGNPRQPQGAGIRS